MMASKNSALDQGPPGRRRPAELPPENRCEVNSLACTTALVEWLVGFFEVRFMTGDLLLSLSIESKHILVPTTLRRSGEMPADLLLWYRPTVGVGQSNSTPGQDRDVGAKCR